MLELRTGRLVALLAGVLLALVLGMGTASAQTDPYVSDEGQTSGASGSGTEVLSSGAAASEPSSGSLAFTGGEIAVLATIGGALVLVGGAVVIGSRRRTADV